MNFDARAGHNEQRETAKCAADVTSNRACASYKEKRSPDPPPDLDMLASEITVPEPAIPALNLRALARRLVVPALLAAAAVVGVLLLGGRIHVFADALRRGLSVSPVWVIVGVAFECISLAGYVALLALVAGRATGRVGTRESAQITFAGAAATRLLPTAGAGGAALALYALRRAGLKPAAAARTLLVFLVLLYSVFLASIAVSGAALALGLVHGHGPAALSALPAAGAIVAIALALVFATVVGGEAGEPAADQSRVSNAVRLVGGAVRDAIALLRSADHRLLGAAAYWAFDAAVLWAMLHAFGSPPSLPVVGAGVLRRADRQHASASRRGERRDGRRADRVRVARRARAAGRADVSHDRRVAAAARRARLTARDARHDRALGSRGLRSYSDSAGNCLVAERAEAV